MKKALRLPVAVSAILFFGIVGVVLFRVAADDTPQSIVLKWNPPAPRAGITVTGYNVYRSGPGGNFGPPIYVTVPTYVDSDVHRGKTYTYFVRTVAANGYESPPSNQASVTIP